MLTRIPFPSLSSPFPSLPSPPLSSPSLFFPSKPILSLSISSHPFRPLFPSLPIPSIPFPFFPFPSHPFPPLPFPPLRFLSLPIPSLPSPPSHPILSLFFPLAKQSMLKHNIFGKEVWIWFANIQDEKLNIKRRKEIDWLIDWELER